MEVKKYSLKKQLLKNNLIDKKFCNQLNRLTLEDLITLKLEISAELVKGKLMGFPILKFVNDITREALIKFALSSGGSYREASKILGISHAEIYNFIKKHQIGD